MVPTEPSYPIPYQSSKLLYCFHWQNNKFHCYINVVKAACLSSSLYLIFQICVVIQMLHSGGDFSDMWTCGSHSHHMWSHVLQLEPLNQLSSHTPCRQFAWLYMWPDFWVSFYKCTPITVIIFTCVNSKNSSSWTIKTIYILTTNL